MNRKWKLTHTAFVYIFTMLFLGLAGGGVQISAAVADNYEKIYTAYDLYAVRTNMEANYILMNDIDLSEFTAPGGELDGGKGWIPLGGTDGFAGTFDGNGYTIKGMQIFGSPTYPYVGLFGRVTGSVKNIILEDSYIDISSSSVYVAGIAGYLDGGVIENCTNDTVIQFEAATTSNPKRYVGGITAMASNGTILKSTNLADITASREISSVSDLYCSTGGIVGATSTETTIQECFNTGDISCYQYNLIADGKSIVYTGGICARALENLKVLNSYNKGNLLPESYYLSVETGEQEWGLSYSGGIAGYAGSNDKFENCFSTGEVKHSLASTGYYGGLLGKVSSTVQISRGYYLKDVFEQGIYGKSDAVGVCESLNEYQFTLQTSFVDYDFQNIWEIRTETEIELPQLKHNREARILKLEFIRLPEKLEYELGTDDSLDFEGGTLEVSYSNGVSVEFPLTEDMVKSYQLIQTGKQEIFVQYETAVTSYEIMVLGRSLDYVNLELQADEYMYTGAAILPEVVLMDDDKKLVEHVDYTLKYENNTDAGFATITVTGICNYAGTLTTGFTIVPKSLTALNVSLSTSSYTYTGLAKKPAVVIKDGANVLVLGEDYEVSYANNVKAGTGKVTVSGLGNYTDTLELNFTIKKTAISKATVTAIAQQTYAGKAIKPKVTVKYSGKTLKFGTDYTLSYKNNNAPGKATITITGKGNFSSSKAVTFQIAPAKSASVTVASKKTTTATVTWKAVTGASGYEVSYSTSKTKSFKVAGSTTSKTLTISKLKKGTTYYVRVRAYKTISGKKVYGAYTTVKAVKVK